MITVSEDRRNAGPASNARVPVSSVPVNIDQPGFICSPFCWFPRQWRKSGAYLLVALMSWPAMAEMLSQHNEQHVAMQAARDRLYDAGCIRTLDTRSERFEMHSTPDAAAYNTYGPAWTTRCIKWGAGKPIEPPIYDHELTWSHANSRIDGTPMQLSEVKRYEIERNRGTVVDVGLVNRFTFRDVGAGSAVYRIRTVDMDDQEGPWSYPVTL